MPQVQVALRKKARGEPVKSGDVVSYVITGGEGSEATDNVSDRAYAPQDIMKVDSGLKPGLFQSFKQYHVYQLTSSRCGMVSYQADIPTY